MIPLIVYLGLPVLVVRLIQALFLRKDKRSSNKATLYCVGRDIEQRELSLEFDANNHIWNLVADSIEQPMKFIDETIFLLSDVIKSVGYFQGTASELIELLKLENMSPSVLAKKIVKNSTELEKLGIHFETRRTGQCRELRLSYDGNDTNDGKRDMSQDVSFLSLPSQTV